MQQAQWQTSYGWARWGRHSKSRWYDADADDETKVHG